MLASISNSTIKQYNVSLRKWWIFCEKNNINVFQSDSKQVVKFLSMCQYEGASYNSLNAHLSAIKLITDITGNLEIFKRFLKGAFRIKPCFPKYQETWDPEKVLNYLSKLYPLENISFDMLSIKLVTLLALTSAHRMQTLSKIQLNNIYTYEDRIEIVITDVIKTSYHNKSQPILRFPIFREKPELCVATTLCFYINATRPKRCDKNNNYLLLTHKKPYRVASTQTLSRWIKKALERSGIDVNKFKGYSTRHSAVSAASRQGVNIETIRSAAGWTAKSNMFVRFYDRPILDKCVFAKSILGMEIN
ncbi:uncharacterized protein LOC126737682 [Anthonomus grandis grandis]|uniref:uncharacterized protein LOC126737682 n=1 Tax=Anthonomus grandis grandis TaxID=2921223 RepID=UPI0021664379|nr:uncharacterized protein LOC126736864 isoform X2 [Anthonomus grandis grandis]XP_050298636.1 uncharacterized protein LOC126737682 [Anthonomus grandis grandis]XP_050298637.1 uncharacterized protein LOC126737682 [Anthonomus grandis grandis]